MKKFITYFVLFFMIITFLGCKGKNSDNPPEFSYFGKFPEQQLDNIESFASANGAVPVIFDSDRDILDSYYSLELKKLFRINEQQKIAFPCSLVDVNKIDDSYFIIVENYSLFAPEIKYKLECSEYIAEKLLQLHPGEFETIVVIALLSEINQPLLNLSTDFDGEVAYITVDDYNNTFIAKGICSAFKMLPTNKKSKE